MIHPICRSFRNHGLLAPALGAILAAVHVACPQMVEDQITQISNRHLLFHEVIRRVQPALDRGEPVSILQLTFLAEAYGETRNYTRLFTTCDLLRVRIQAGDRTYQRSDFGSVPHRLLAKAWLDLGDPARALEQAEEAEAELAAHPSRPGDHLAPFWYPEVWGSLGVAQALLSRPSGAEHCLRRLESLDSWGLGPEKYAAIARINMALGRPQGALDALDNPQAGLPPVLDVLLDMSSRQLPMAFMRARCCYQTGQLDLARKGYDGLLRFQRLANVGGLYWQVLLDRARIARQDGQDPMAEALLRQAVDIIEGQRATIGTEAGRIGFVGDKQACYQEWVRLLVDHGRASEAFAVVERSKGRALVDLLASQQQLGKAGKDPRTAQDLGQLAQADQDLQAIPAPDAPSDRGIIVAARKDLASRAPELASLVMVPQVATSALQARLDPDETLLEYYACGTRWLAFTVTRESVAATWLPTPDLVGRVLVLRRGLADPAGPAAAAAAELYRLLLEPVAARLRSSRLTIVPHGILHYVPFCALGQGDTLLLDRFSLRMLPSATVLAFLKPRVPVKDTLILGNPDLSNPALDLPFAQEEAVALAGILPHPTLRVRGEATSASVLEAGGRFGIVHLAAHGFFDLEHPLESALFLAPTARTRGTLKVADLYSLDLDADLVTLSACETALSKVASGDDVVGFTRGLLYAGSRSVLSSLWKVDDRSTKELMLAFYRRLGDVDKAEALRQAQLEVRAHTPQPFYWAAFTLAGNAR